MFHFFRTRKGTVTVSSSHGLSMRCMHTFIHRALGSGRRAALYWDTLELVAPPVQLKALRRTVKRPAAPLTSALRSNLANKTCRSVLYRFRASAKGPDYLGIDAVQNVYHRGCVGQLRRNEDEPETSSSLDKQALQQ